jgi:hypothetical protein
VFRPADRDRLVARRRPPPSACLLRIRVPKPRRLRDCDPVTARCPLGSGPQGIHPGLGQRPHRDRPARRCTLVRPLGYPTRLPGLWLGSRPRRQRGGSPTTRQLSSPTQRSRSGIAATCVCVTRADLSERTARALSSGRRCCSAPSYCLSGDEERGSNRLGMIGAVTLLSPDIYEGVQAAPLVFGEDDEVPYFR